MPHVWQTLGPGEPLVRQEVPPLEPGRDELVLEVLHCGLCHSDASMIDNAWGMSAYPLVAGHEAVGRVMAVGDGVDPALIGQLRGLGWFAGSCGHCDQCLAGRANLCDTAEATIVGRPGAFASHVKARQDWAIPLPEGLDPAAVGPLYCGGITVFAPLFDEEVSPTARVAVIGVGGLGHIALQFCRAWGCEVTAVTGNPAKAEEARQLGAHAVVALPDLADHSGRFDLIINTTNQPLAWGVVIGSLGRLGRLHLLGAVLEPLQVNAFDLIVTPLRRWWSGCRWPRSTRRSRGCGKGMCATGLCWMGRPEPAGPAGHVANIDRAVDPQPTACRLIPLRRIAETARRRPCQEEHQQRHDLVGGQIASTIFMGLPVAAWNHGFCRQSLAWQCQLTVP